MMVGKTKVHKLKNSSKEIYNFTNTKDKKKESEQTLLFSNLRIGEPKIPRKNQAAKFKVPETDLNMNNEYIEIETKVPGCRIEDIALSLTSDTLILNCSNKNVAYFSDLKLPEKIIPQSAISVLNDESLYLRAEKQKDISSWLGIINIITLTSDLNDTKERLKKFQEQYHTIQLEYQNLLVRSDKEIESKIDNYKISIIERILTNIDNFELALKSAEKSKNKENEQIIIGIKLILNDLRNLLLEEGVEEVVSIGLLMNPNQHEVLDFIETDKYPEDTIVEEYQKGYKYKNRIIRPSKVKVAKFIHKRKLDQNQKGKNE